MSKISRKFYCVAQKGVWAGYLSRFSDWLRVGRSGDRIPVWARFTSPIQTDPGSHPAPCKMGTGSFPVVKSGRGVTLTPHPLLVPWSRKSRAIPLLPLLAVRPVQSFSDCTMVHFTFTLQKGVARTEKGFCNMAPSEGYNDYVLYLKCKNPSL